MTREREKWRKRENEKREEKKDFFVFKEGKKYKRGNEGFRQDKRDDGRNMMNEHGRKE